jgi:hypothetical protein
MIGSLVTMMVLSAGGSGSAEALTKHQVKNVSLKVPAEWEQSVEDGSHKFSDPEGNAWFTVDVGAVQTEGMDGATCLGKITTSLGGEGWKKVKIGKAPAATRTVTDTSSDGEVEVQTVSYVGCDGKTTWSLLFSLDKKQKGRFTALAKKVAQSVTYARAGGK